MRPLRADACVHVSAAAARVQRIVAAVGASSHFESLQGGAGFQQRRGAAMVGAAGALTLCLHPLADVHPHVIERLPDVRERSHPPAF